MARPNFARIAVRFSLIFAPLLFLAAQGARAQSYYGSKWAADSLANTRIGPVQVQGDYRFRATHTGTLAAIHTYFQTGTGYSGGTLGTYRIDLETDDGTPNHFASGTVLATTTELHPASHFVTETFSSPAVISSGALYHVVYTNIDASPAISYSSLDMLMLSSPGPTPSQPTIADTDWAHLYNAGTIANPKWHWRHGATEGDYMPTLELVYGDGTIAGNGYMEVWVKTSRENISGSFEARETFTVSGGDRIATSFSVRLRKDSGADPLTVTLETGSGATVESGTIPAAAFTTTDGWATYTFSTPRTLSSGATYDIILSAPGSSSYSLFPIRKGRNYNFDSPTFFSDGYAQLSTNGGSSWTNWPAETGVPSPDGDLQFFFTIGGVAPPAAPTDLRVNSIS